MAQRLDARAQCHGASGDVNARTCIMKTAMDKPTRDAPHISCVVPAYNEARNLGPLLMGLSERLSGTAATTGKSSWSMMVAVTPRLLPCCHG